MASETNSATQETPYLAKQLRNNVIFEKISVGLRNDIAVFTSLYLRWNMLLYTWAVGSRKILGQERRRGEGGSNFQV